MPTKEKIKEQIAQILKEQNPQLTPTETNFMASQAANHYDLIKLAELRLMSTKQNVHTQTNQ